MDTCLLKHHPELRRIVLAAFPSYRKLKAFVHVTSQVNLNNTFWDGGSRATYVVVRLTSYHGEPLPHYKPPQFGGPREPPVVVIAENTVIVEGGTFCGKPATACVYARQEDRSRLLSTDT